MEEWFRHTIAQITSVSMAGGSLLWSRVHYFILQFSQHKIFKNSILKFMVWFGDFTWLLFCWFLISIENREFCTNKRYYEGQWKNNSWNGEGMLETVDGWKYIGNFKDDLREGVFSCFDNWIEEIREYKEDKPVD